MSNILIKGMEMPKGKPIRIVLNPNGQLFVDHGVHFTEYEAVELPPHGKLINADALDIRRREQQAWQDYEYNPDNEYLEGVKDGLHEAAKCLSAAPIIIEADPEEEEMK